MTRSPAAEAAEALARVRAALPAGMGVDRSRVDHAMAVRLLRPGVDVEFVEAAVLAGERATELPARAAIGYAERTIAAAASAVGVSGSRR
jgi:hypothetical protein